MLGSWARRCPERTVSSGSFGDNSSVAPSTGPVPWPPLSPAKHTAKLQAWCGPSPLLSRPRPPRRMSRKNPGSCDSENQPDFGARGRRASSPRLPAWPCLAPPLPASVLASLSIRTFPLSSPRSPPCSPSAQARRGLSFLPSPQAPSSVSRGPGAASSGFLRHPRRPGSSLPQLGSVCSIPSLAVSDPDPACACGIQHHE